ncbi:MAG: septum formation family protein [Ilumatobacteraceae bacterium]
MSVSLSRVATVVVICSVLASCGGGSSGDATTEPASDGTAAEATTPADDAIAPYCAIEPDEGRFREMPCDGPHDAELAAIVDRPEASGDEMEVQVARLQACRDAVESLTGRSLDTFGLDVGVGNDITSPPSEDRMACYATTTTLGGLRASIREVGLDAAIGDNVFVVDLEPGSCYVVVTPDGHDIVREAECDEDGATQILSIETLPDDDYADEDAVIDAAVDLCDPVWGDPPFELIGDDLSLTYPDLQFVLAFDQRTIICKTRVLVDDGAGSDAESGAEEVSNCAGRGDEQFPPVPCDEPHGSEFVGTVESPVDTLPDDITEAGDVLTAACRPVVEEFLGRAVDVPGASVGFLADAELGGPVVGDLECFLTTNGDEILLGLVADIGWDAALNDVAVVNEMEIGSCFVLGEEAFAFGTPVDCAEPGALMHLGSFDLDDGPFPGDDTIREIREIRCAEILADSGLAADPSTVSGTFPGEKDWTRLDWRLVTCDASPL